MVGLLECPLGWTMRGMLNTPATVVKRVSSERLTGRTSGSPDLPDDGHRSTLTSR